MWRVTHTHTRLPHIQIRPTLEVPLGPVRQLSPSGSEAQRPSCPAHLRLTGLGLTERQRLLTAVAQGLTEAQDLAQS